MVPDLSKRLLPQIAGDHGQVPARVNLSFVGDKAHSSTRKASLRHRTHVRRVTRRMAGVMTRGPHETSGLDFNSRPAWHHHVGWTNRGHALSVSTLRCTCLRGRLRRASFRRTPLTNHSKIMRRAGSLQFNFASERLVVEPVQHALVLVSRHHLLFCNIHSAAYR